MKNVIKELSIGTKQIVPIKELEKKLLKGRCLKIKLGMDPTVPDLHLGHAVVLNKLKQFQDFGHEIIFLIGDFTARIGDPTGKSKMRPPLGEDDICNNTKTYFEQVGRILDPSKITVVYNSSWLDKLSCKDIVKLCSKITVARLIERDDFSKRLKKKIPVGMHELLYPIFQGYDSVELKADIEIGGTDQTFNLLVGRYLQEQYGQEPQVIITLPLLEGLDGKEKMSKSLGNYIGLTEDPKQAYGKLMSISDSLMLRYYALLLDYSAEQIETLLQDLPDNPMQQKKRMAFEIISRYWSEKDAKNSKEYFENIFQKKDYSKANEITLSKNTQNPIWIVDLLKTLNAVETSSEAKRLILSGAVSVNDEKASEFKAQIKWSKGTIVKVGKHKIYSIL